MKRIEKMIAPLSSSSATPLRPITVMPMACQCMECAPQRVMKSPSAPIAAPAPAIDSKSAVSPGLNLVVAQAGAESGETGGQTTTGAPKEAPAKDTETTDTGSKNTTQSGELTEEEKAQIAKLRARDREVRAHEQAHAAAGAGIAGAPSYSYQQGPDGRQYAVGGEVSVRASASSSNPRQALAQLQQVARAALAPANPSGQDRAVAAQARAQAAQIQAQLAQEAQAKAQEALQGSAEPAHGAAGQTAPAESKPLLPELPKISPPAGSTGDAPGPDRKAGVVSPLPASVIAPPEKKPSHAGFGESDGGSGIGGAIAAYQQAAQSSGGNPSGGIKPVQPGLNGRIISLNA